MRHTAPATRGSPNYDPLADLGLSGEDLACLARQGCVTAEFRGQSGPYYKLRWRRDGRQRVLYLGRDSTRAEEVRAALEISRMPLRRARRLSLQMKKARRGLQEVRNMVAPLLAVHGLHYHGYAARGRVRRGRGPRTPAGETTQETLGGAEKGTVNSLSRTLAMEGMVHE